MKPVFLVACIGIFSCDGSSEERSIPPIESPPVNPIEVFEPIVLNEAAQLSFKALEDLCEGAGGSFDQLRGRCLCSTDEAQFQPIFKKSRDRTINIVEGYHCQELDYLKPDTDGFETFLELLEYSEASLRSDLYGVRFYNNRRVLRITLDPNLSYEELRELANYLDSNKVFYKIPSGVKRGYVLNILYSKNSDSYSLDSYIQAHNMFEDIEDPQLVAGISTIATSPEQLSAILNPKFVYDSSRLDGFEGLRIGLKKLEKYYQGQESLEVNSHKIRSQKEGCAGICIFDLDFSESNELFTLSTKYILGSVASQYLSHHSKTDTSLSTALLGANGKISHIVRQTISSNIVSTESFDLYANLQKKQEDNVFEDPVRIYDIASTLLNESDSNESAIRVALNADTISLTSEWLHDYLLTGPYHSTDILSGGSLLGWNEFSNDRPSRFFEFYKGITTNIHRQSTHGESVSFHTLEGIEPGDVFMVPIGGDIYSSSRSEVLSNFKPQIIVNAGSTQVDDNECNSVFEDDQKVLWIHAAGNAGLENPRYRCPQNFRNNSNSIVVAAGDFYGLKDWSDFGVLYADIAADWNARFEGSGTSFSAPRVANVAAKILVKYGRQTDPQLVRMAILLGARVNTSNRLPLRTGGVLSEESALMAMDAIMGEKGPLPLNEDDRLVLVEKGHPDRKWAISRVLKNLPIYSRDQVASQTNFLMENNI